MSQNATDPAARVEAPAAKDPMVRRLIVAAMLLGFALYTIYDHYIQGNYQDGADFNVHWKYLFNHFLPYVIIPPGLAFLIHAGRKIVADAAGIGLAGKAQIAWADISQVDARPLAAKGWLILHYGQTRQLKLDSYAYKNFRELVAFVERHVPAERIIR